jgi:hypothetical protein
VAPELHGGAVGLGLAPSQEFAVGGDSALECKPQQGFEQLGCCFGIGFGAVVAGQPQPKAVRKVSKPP